MKNFDTRPFRFRRFSLHHHRSTMKVGTDAVLLGIWTDVSNVETALDIGTGSGILSLLLASRCEVTVDAVDIDRDSVQEAKKNFSNSPFKNQLHVYHDDFVHFASVNKKQYELIVSNPPFFVNDLPSEDKKKTLARHTQSLQYYELIKGTAQLLKTQGRFCLVLPYYESQNFVTIAKTVGLCLQKQMLIFPKFCKEPNRVNLQLGFQHKKLNTEKFIIRNENNSYTGQYVNMVKNYYISNG